MTPDQAKSSEAILNMVLKFIFGIAILVAFFIVLFRWLDSKTNFDLLKYGSMEAFLTITLGYGFRHYFGFIRKK